MLVLMAQLIPSFVIFYIAFIRSLVYLESALSRLRWLEGKLLDKLSILKDFKGVRNSRPKLEVKSGINFNNSSDNQCSLWTAYAPLIVDSLFAVWIFCSEKYKMCGMYRYYLISSHAMTRWNSKFRSNRPRHSVEADSRLRITNLFTAAKKIL